MTYQSLNGEWLYRIGGGEETVRKVPFSAIPVGKSFCTKKFDTEYTSERIRLFFDGITYHAKVTLNGRVLGEMLPYCEYSFDVTDIIKSNGNKLAVELDDISPVFGPTEGWQNYGGIVRDVYLVYNEKNYIKDVFFHAELKNDYTDAEYTVEIESSEGGVYLVELSYGDRVVSSYTTADKISSKTLESVRLWSVDTPELYSLKVSLLSCGRVVDTYSCNVGFREIKCDRHRFIINGKSVFLSGVCKHEFIGDSGHTVTEEQMEQDMLMIKSTGCNFVRLVHYPHNKKILDIADRIGLMVSEEPGLWWSETGDPDVAAGSLEVLRRTIMRDRNHVSIAFWLCFNECKFTESFLVESAKVCKQTDPYRMVSGANCMSNEDTLKYYNICGFDFYTMHPYAPTFERAQTSAKILHDKPLLLTEWGGYYVYNNPNLLTDFFKGFAQLYHANSDSGALAGAFLWCWAEVDDFNRGLPFCVDGLLIEGLVDKYRNPRLNYEYFCRAIENFNNVHDTSFKCTEFDGIGKTAFICNDEAILDKKIVTGKQFCTMRVPQIKTGPILKNDKGINERPILTSDNCTSAFYGECESDCITVIGATSLSRGYPVSGEYGEEAFEVTAYSVSGEKETYVMRNGVDFTTAYTLLGSSVINPRAEKATELARFSYDKNFENYIVNRLDIKLPRRMKINKIEISSLGKGYDLLTYGIFA